MKKFCTKKHWENIYDTREFPQMGWYQKIPVDSLIFFQKMSVSKDARIIDIGGGDSYLVDYLLSLGYNDISVLDISEKALEKAKKRLGQWADKVKWISSDINHFSPTQTYDVWHDRAAFHFLLDDVKIRQYVETAEKSLSSKGMLFVGTFSQQGPLQCSGLPVTRYTKEKLAETFSPYFEEIYSLNTDHVTPSGGVQNYSYSALRKKAGSRKSKNEC